MPVRIPVQALPAPDFNRLVNGCFEQVILPNEIQGARTFFKALPARQSSEINPAEHSLYILFFLEAQGTLKSQDRTFALEDLSLCIPAPSAPFVIEAGERSLSLLEIRWALMPDDGPALEKASAGLPYFITYRECKTYQEAIKSPKTINRTLVPENLVPRFCMGSVETEGPDLVAAHSHPMLEQHFFGLKGNDCIVRADDAEVPFPENTLLHIPLGSEHSVHVLEGHKLHYLWLDYFRDQKGMEWITQMHKTNE